MGTVTYKHRGIFFHSGVFMLPFLRALIWLAEFLDPPGVAFASSAADSASDGDLNKGQRRPEPSLGFVVELKALGRTNMPPPPPAAVPERRGSIKRLQEAIGKVSELQSTRATKAQALGLCNLQGAVKGIKAYAVCATPVASQATRRAI